MFSWTLGLARQEEMAIKYCCELSKVVEVVEATSNKENRYCMQRKGDLKKKRHADIKTACMRIDRL